MDEASFASALRCTARWVDLQHQISERHRDCIELSAPAVHIRRVARWAVTGVVVVLFFLHSAGFVTGIRDAMRDGQLQALSIELLTGFVVGLMFLFLVYPGGLVFLNYSQQFRWDRADATFTEIAPRWLLPVHRTVQTRLDDVEGLRLGIQRMEQPLRLDLAVR